MRLWRMHGDYDANHIKYNGNDVADCFVINCILQNNEWWKGNGKLKDFLKLQHLDVLRGRLLGSHINFHWQLGGQKNHQPCSSNDISHCSSSQLSTELDCQLLSKSRVKK